MKTLHYHGREYGLTKKGVRALKDLILGLEIVWDIVKFFGTIFMIFVLSLVLIRSFDDYCRNQLIKQFPPEVQEILWENPELLDTYLSGE